MMRIHLKLSLALVICGCFSSAATAQGGSHEDEEMYVQAGQKALAAGQFAEAQDNFEKLAKLEPGIAEVHATLAAIYFKQSRYDLSVREVRTAKKLKPSLPRLDSLLGLSLSELNQFEEALPHLEKGFHQTADTDVQRMCGLQLLRAYTGLSRDGDAVETALALNKLYPDDPEVLYHTGRIYGNFAFIVMTKLHDKAPGSIWMLQAQGEMNESQKSYDEAIFAYNHVLSIEPRRPGVHYRIGRIYLTRYKEGQKAEDRDAAVREFTAELDIDPGNGNAGYELADIQAELGNLEDARKGYEHVLELFPNFEEALVGLGGVYTDSHKPEQAVTLLEHATQLKPDDEIAWYRLARAERAIGNRDAQQKALAVFQKLHSAKPLHKPVTSDEVTPQQLDRGAQP